MNPTVRFSRVEPHIHFNVKLLHSATNWVCLYGPSYRVWIKSNGPNIKLWGLVQRNFLRVSWHLCCQLTSAVFQNTATDIEIVWNLDEHEGLGTNNFHTYAKDMMCEIPATDQLWDLSTSKLFYLVLSIIFLFGNHQICSLNLRTFTSLLRDWCTTQVLHKAKWNPLSDFYKILLARITFQVYFVCEIYI